jgi:hypothetical protein
VSDNKVELESKLTVDELTNRLLVWVTISNKRLNNLQHLHGRLGKLDENTIVDLEEPKELQCLAFLGINLVDTLYPNDEGEFWLSGDVEAVALLGFARHAHPLTLRIAVLLHILLSPCEDDLALLLILVCFMSALFKTVWHAMSFKEGDRIIPERWLTIRQH